MKKVIIAGLLVWMVMVVGLVSLGARNATPDMRPVLARNPGLRLVVVSSDLERAVTPGETEGILSARYVSGRLPDAFTRATVLTDTNCQADATGVSHCTNDLQVGNTRLTIQHDHDMRQVPCLSPGEEVELVTYDAYTASY
jgi:hypothetical protein